MTASPAGDRRARFLRALARQPVDRAAGDLHRRQHDGQFRADVVAVGFYLARGPSRSRRHGRACAGGGADHRLESVGIPLCTTVEAEAFDAEIDLGDAVTEHGLFVSRIGPPATFPHSGSRQAAPRPHRGNDRGGTAARGNGR